MKKYGLVWNKKRLKEVPKKYLLAMAVWMLAFVCFLAGMCLPVYHTLDDLQERTMTLDGASIRTSWGLQNRRTGKKVVLESDGVRYYTWFPRYLHTDGGEQLVQDFEAGQCTTVTVLYSGRQSILDSAFGNIKVVEIRAGSRVYYSLDQERQVLDRGRTVHWLVVLPALLLMLVPLILLLWGYRVVSYKRIQ